MSKKPWDQLKGATGYPNISLPTQLVMFSYRLTIKPWLHLHSFPQVVLHLASHEELLERILTTAKGKRLIVNND